MTTLPWFPWRVNRNRHGEGCRGLIHAGLFHWVTLHHHSRMGDRAMPVQNGRSFVTRNGPQLSMKGTASVQPENNYDLSIPLDGCSVVLRVLRGVLLVKFLLPNHGLDVAADVLDRGRWRRVELPLTQSLRIDPRAYRR